MRLIAVIKVSCATALKRTLPTTAPEVAAVLFADVRAMIAKVVSDTQRWKVSLFSLRLDGTK